MIQECKRSQKSSDFSLSFFCRRFLRRSQNRIQAPHFRAGLKPEGFCDFIRRGELRDHVLSIIVGVVSLGLLLLAAWYLMQAYTVSDHDKAVSALRTIELKLRAIEAGESARFPLQGPEGWYVQGWHATEAGRPERCYFKSCICVCKDAGKEGADSCQDTKTGTCLDIEEKELFVGSEFYRLIQGGSIAGGGGGNVPVIPAPTQRSETKERCSRILLSGNLIEVSLTKEFNRLELVYSSDTAIDFTRESMRGSR